MRGTMHPMLDTAVWTAANPDPSLVIADGTSVTVNVYGGMLVIKDGPMGAPRERRIARVPRTTRHLAILCDHGYLSLDAMAWLDDCQITWSIIDRSGQFPRTLATSGRYVRPDYMRRQALCAPGMPNAGTGVKIFRHLITAKVEGQARNAETLLNDKQAAEKIRRQLPLIDKARSIDTIRGYEGTAADHYWDAWRGMIIQWSTPRPLQRHWVEYPSRRSLRRNWETNRGATDPVNALLNFGYHCAEIECSLACYAASLSPAMGIGHVDRPGRDSFALDLIEPIRPIVDKIVLDILARPLDKRMFREGKQSNAGVVNLCSPMTHRLLAAVHAQSMEVVKALFPVMALIDSVKRKQAGKSDELTEKGQTT